MWGAAARTTASVGTQQRWGRTPRAAVLWADSERPSAQSGSAPSTCASTRPSPPGSYMVRPAPIHLPPFQSAHHCSVSFCSDRYPEVEMEGERHFLPCFCSPCVPLQADPGAISCITLITTVELPEYFLFLPDAITRLPVTYGGLPPC